MPRSRALPRQPVRARRASASGSCPHCLRATPEERDFLFRLLLGELRQGAQESLMIDAVAAAASLPAFSVRQAAMVANGIAAVAHAAR